MKKIVHILWSAEIGGAEMQLLQIMKHYSSNANNDFGHHICVLNGVGPLLQVFRELPFPVTTFQAKNGLDVKQMWRFVQYIRALQPCIIHLHSIISTAVLAKLFTSAVIIRTDHGGRLLNASGKQRNKIKLSMRLSSPFIDKHVAVSELVKKELHSVYSINPTNIEVIYNGIDPNTPLQKREILRSSYGYSDSEYVIGVVCRLLTGKGVHYVIRAAKLLLDQGVSCRVAILGTGPSQQELMQLADSLGIRSKIDFWGHRTEAFRIYPMFDVFVFSSIWNESFGITMLEAMCANVPIIAFNRGATSEIIQHEYNGLLIEPSEVTLAESLLRVKNNKNCRLAFLKHGLDQIHGKFQIRQTCKRLLALYRQLGKG